ncbi:DUF4767 domain-containing protein [Loigolactobacillus zhaoyuanensis]|uniref:DUF4767 domain-containing protein n=1 Tax=Loigolactobacillus zhaoyuanensis TaxID=2486017 RepID=A0ABW8UEV8_9LACO
MQQKLWGSLLLLGTLGILTGCGRSADQAENHSSQTSSKSANLASLKAENSSLKQQSSSSSVAKAESSSATPASLWNQAKAAQLADFMDSWGTIMNQQYQSYGPGNDTNYYGIAFPSGFDKIALNIDNQKYSAAWSDDGNGTADYDVVAIYCNSETAHAMGEILYLFAYVQQEPVVLVTQQTNGDVTNEGVHFRATENQDLTAGFKKIAEK